MMDRREQIQNIREQQEADQAQAKARERREAIELLASGLMGTAIFATLLFKARQAVKSGNYAKATYYAVLWSGVTRNSNEAIYRKLDERRSRQAL